MLCLGNNRIGVSATDLSELDIETQIHKSIATMDHSPSLSLSGFVKSTQTTRIGEDVELVSSVAG